MAPKLDSETAGSQLVAEYAEHIKGKTVLVTGVSPGGLGAIFVETVAKGQPSLLIVAGRNTAKVQKTADTITSAHPAVRVKTLELDLGSLKGARAAAETVNAWDDVPHIDVLVNNAGIMAVPYSKTADGFESQFATNHLAHFLFTNLVMPKVLASKAPRIIAVSSDGHRASPIRWTDYNYDEGRHYNPWSAYGQSKTANILMALWLAEKLGPKGLLSFSLHPGVIWTNLAGHLDPAEFEGLRNQDIAMGTKYMWTELKFKTNDQGVATHVYTAFSPDLADVNGAYFQDCHVADPYQEEVYPWATSKIEADKLWTLSEKLVGQEFKY